MRSRTSGIIAVLAVAGAVVACGSGSESRVDEAVSADHQPPAGNTAAGPTNDGPPKVDNLLCAWKPYNEGIRGGYVVDALFDARSPGVAWAASGSHLYRSADHGATWTLHSQAPSSFRQLAIVGGVKDRILAATNSGVVRSDDGGHTWAQAIDGVATSAILVHPKDPLRVYVGIHGAGIFRSDDGGVTWGAVNFEVPYTEVLYLEADPSNPDIVTAAATLLDSTGNYNARTGELIRTTDGGVTWAPVMTGHGITYRIDRCASDPSLVYATSDDGLLRSTNRGATWALAYAMPHAIDVALAGADCKTVFATAFGDGLHRSTDGAATFSPLLADGIPFVNAFPRKVSVDPSDATRLIGATPGGLLLTTNAGTHWALADAMMELGIRRIATSPTAPSKMWMATWGSGLYARDSAATSWAAQPLAADYLFTVDPDRAVANRTFIGAWSNIVTTTDGAHFVGTDVNQNPMQFAFDPNPKIVYAATQIDGVYKSTDAGATWARSNGGLTPWYTGNGTFIDVRSILLDTADNHSLFIATNLGGIYRSTDSAATWTPVGFPTKSAGCLTERDGVIYACVIGAGIQRTSDHGTTWTSASTGLPTEDVNDLLVDPVTKAIFATTGSGVYRSNNGGTTWTGVDLACLPPKGAGSQTIVQTGATRSLAVVSGDGLGVYIHGI